MNVFALAGFAPGSEPLYVLEMKGIQTGLRANENRPGYSSFACMGHKWEDDYLQNSCRSAFHISEVLLHVLTL